MLAHKGRAREVKLLKLCHYNVPMLITLYRSRFTNSVLPTVLQRYY